VTSFAVVGAGFRAAAYLRLAAVLDGPACVGAVVRSPRPLPVPAFGSLSACLAAASPDFLVTALPPAANATVLAEAVRLGIPVLSETPAAGVSRLIQVAEQYLLMPTHAARLAAVRAGLIGAPTQVQVSSTQLHHAVSLMRGMLGADVGPVSVRASRHTAPLVSPLSRTGWTDDAVPHPAVTTIAMLFFGSDKSGLYDFTDNQTRNQLRFRRILVRGTHGELQDDALVRLAGRRTIVRTPLVRDGDVISLDGRVLYRNPFPGLRLNDDEIATATILTATAAWVRGDGPPPYPLELGAHDHRVGQAITAAADTGRTVTTD
jgi:predicted dehydrogenase